MGSIHNVHVPCSAILKKAGCRRPNSTFLPTQFSSNSNFVEILLILKRYYFLISGGRDSGLQARAS